LMFREALPTASTQYRPAIISNLANVLRDNQELDEALKFYQQALDLAGGVNRRLEGQIYTNMALVALELGETERGEAYLEQGLAARREAEDLLGQAMTLY